MTTSESTDPRPSLFPSGNSGGNCAVLDSETSDFCASSRKTRISAEAYSSTPHKGIRSLTTKLPESAVSGRELACIMPVPMSQGSTDKLSVAASRLVNLFRSVHLWLTPQAMNVPPLRGWCVPSKRNSRRVVRMRDVIERRRRDRSLAWGVSPRSWASIFLRAPRGDRLRLRREPQPCERLS